MPMRWEEYSGSKRRHLDAYWSICTDHRDQPQLEKSDHFLEKFWFRPGYGVRNVAKAYMKGFMESNMVCAMKHFPGDGVDERDQRLSNSVNTYSTEEWDATFGKVYSGMIDAAVHTVMAGHIMLPSYQKYFNHQMELEDTLPATLSKELIDGLLKEKLGFNGMVVTDASHMVGMTSVMKRSKMLPTAIAAGCGCVLILQ